MSKWEWGSIRNWWLKAEEANEPTFNPEVYFTQPTEVTRYTYPDGTSLYFVNGSPIDEWELSDLENIEITDHYIDNSTVEETEEEPVEEAPRERTAEEVWNEIIEDVRYNYDEGIAALFDALKDQIIEVRSRNLELETQIANLTERLDTMDYYNEAG